MSKKCYYRITYDREDYNSPPRYGIDLDRVYKLPMIKKDIFDEKYRTGKLEEVAPIVINKGKYRGLNGLTVQKERTHVQKCYVANDAVMTAELVRAMDAEIIGTMYSISEFVKLPLHKVCSSTIMTWWESKLGNLGKLPKSIRTEKGEPEFGWRTEGGFIFLLAEDKHYRNVVSLDIAGQYPWVIDVMNISPEMINCQCCKDDPKARVPSEVLVDRKDNPINREYWICKIKKRGIISNIIGEFRQQRLIEKRAGNKPKARALKVTCNGLYGLFRNPAFKWADSRITELTTCFARYFIKQIMELAKQHGFEAVYSHTDSIFFRSETATIEDSKVEEFKKEVESRFGLELDKPVYYDEFLIHKTNNYIGFKRGVPEPEIVGFGGIKNDKPKLVQEAFTEFVYKLKNEGKNSALTVLQQTLDKIKRKEGLDTDPGKWKVETQLKKNPGNYKNKGDLKNRLGQHLGLQRGDLMRCYEIGNYYSDDSDIKELESKEGMDAWLNPANVSVPKYLQILYRCFKPLLKILEIDVNQVFGITKESDLFEKKPKKKERQQQQKKKVQKYKYGQTATANKTLSPTQETMDSILKAIYNFKDIEENSTKV